MFIYNDVSSTDWISTLSTWEFLCCFHLEKCQSIKYSLTFTVTFTSEDRWLLDRPPSHKRDSGVKQVG